MEQKIVLTVSPSCEQVEDELNNNEENKCSTCGTISSQSRVCGRCRKVRYCRLVIIPLNRE